jgi:hypothetical protein
MKKKTSGKRAATGKPFTKNDPRRCTLPGPGRPANVDSVSYWINEAKKATPEQNAEKCEHFKRAFRSFGKAKVPCAGMIGLGQVVTSMTDPESKCVDRVIATDTEVVEAESKKLVVTINIGDASCLNQ